MNLKDYLASNGISNEKLARGEKYALFDTAFFGNIFKAVKSVVSVKEAGQVVGQLLHSANRFVPSTPIFFATVNNRLEKLHDASLGARFRAESADTMVRSYAEDFPKYTRGVSHYQKIDGQLTPVPKDNTQVKDEINPKAVLLQMEHTAWYIRDKITVADIQKKRRMWKQHFQDYQSSTPKTWIQKLRKMENTEDPIELAVLNQLVDVSLGTLDRAELALTEKQIGAYGRIRESRRRAYSKFDFNYDNPHDETQRLIKTKEGRKLLRAVQKISDAISDNVSGIIDQTLTELQEKTEFGSFVETFKKETKAKCRNAIQG